MYGSLEMTLILRAPAVLLLGLVILVAACSEESGGRSTGLGSSGTATTSSTPEGPSNLEVLAKGQTSTGCYVRYSLYGSTQEWQGTGRDCNPPPTAENFANCDSTSAPATSTTGPTPSDVCKARLRLFGGSRCYGEAAVGALLPSECQ